MEDLTKKYPFPDEFSAACSPKINPEIKQRLSDYNLKKDSFQVVAQEKLGRDIYAISLALTSLFNKDGNEIEDGISFLSDAGRMLIDVHHSMFLTRRSFITPVVNQLVKDVSYGTPVTNLLFGDELHTRIKIAKDVEKQSKDMEKPVSNTNIKKNKSFHKPQVKKQQNSGSKLQLNSRGPSKRSFSSQKGYWDGPKSSRTQTHQPYRRNRY